jgi:hypothetical protein
MAFGKVWELFLIEEVLMVPNILMETGFLLRNCTSPPIVGVNVKNFMFAYTYSHVTGPVQFDGLSVGWNQCDHCSKFIF